MTILEAAEVLGLSDSSVLAMVREGKLPATRARVGRGRGARYEVEAAAVLALARSRRGEEEEEEAELGMPVDCLDWPKCWRGCGKCPEPPKRRARNGYN